VDVTVIAKTLKASANVEVFTTIPSSSSSSSVQQLVDSILKKNTAEEELKQYLNLVLEYPHEENSSSQQLETVMSDLVSNHGIIPSLQLRDVSIYKQDAVMVAANIASLLDATTSGGDNMIWITPTMMMVDDEVGQEQQQQQQQHNNENVQDDDIVQLCEELGYLDVAGPTMKSRLVVAIESKNQVEECLLMGINKFVISSTTSNNDDTNSSSSSSSSVLAEEQYEWLNELVQDQGKTFIST